MGEAISTESTVALETLANQVGSEAQVDILVGMSRVSTGSASTDLLERAVGLAMAEDGKAKSRSLIQVLMAGLPKKDLDTVHAGAAELDDKRRARVLAALVERDPSWARTAGIADEVDALDARWRGVVAMALARTSEVPVEGLRRCLLNSRAVADGLERPILEELLQHDPAARVELERWVTQANLTDVNELCRLAAAHPASAAAFLSQAVSVCTSDGRRRSSLRSDLEALSRAPLDSESASTLIAWAERQDGRDRSWILAAVLAIAPEEIRPALIAASVDSLPLRLRSRDLADLWIAAVTSGASPEVCHVFESRAIELDEADQARLLAALIRARVQPEKTQALRQRLLTVVQGLDGQQRMGGLVNALAAGSGNPSTMASDLLDEIAMDHSGWPTPAALRQLATLDLPGELIERFVAVVSADPIDPGGALAHLAGVATTEGVQNALTTAALAMATDDIYWAHVLRTLIANGISTPMFQLVLDRTWAPATRATLLVAGAVGGNLGPEQVCTEVAALLPSLTVNDQASVLLDLVNEIGERAGDLQATCFDLILGFEPTRRDVLLSRIVRSEVWDEAFSDQIISDLAGLSVEAQAHIYGALARRQGDVPPEGAWSTVNQVLSTLTDGDARRSIADDVARAGGPSDLSHGNFVQVLKDGSLSLGTVWSTLHKVDAFSHEDLELVCKVDPGCRWVLSAFATSCGLKPVAIPSEGRKLLDGT